MTASTRELRNLRDPIRDGTSDRHSHDRDAWSSVSIVQVAVREEVGLVAAQQTLKLVEAAAF
jgi:hypothetical protein